jgi:very-short-patch-repair endonuclease
MAAPLKGNHNPLKQPLMKMAVQSGGGDSSRKRATFTIEDIRKRGLIWDGHSLPYNPNIVELARSLRKTMTEAEKKLWYDFLRNHQYKFYRQRPIDHFIADFYCSDARLIIEIDGSQHFTEEGLKRDAVRTDILSLYGLEILRFTNSDVMKRFNTVCRAIEAQFHRDTGATVGVSREKERDPSVAPGDSSRRKGAIFGTRLPLQGRWRETPVGSVSHARSDGGTR